ncbi:hypothetical protein CLV98_101508 [Dyadobacter jejuensis]|uniref:Uncharacterized protein n=1 Tax=Dyadobacter jejuensis TaxID=1082580 RepID=A0A316BCY1_9BACT|nr:hypothetical protein [Dyadobacter jejuensis]PWJ60327.1 hypothetical protein CLV98_101508 [Dyadobacter jejuensis]
MNRYPLLLLIYVLLVSSAQAQSPAVSTSDTTQIVTEKEAEEALEKELKGQADTLYTFQIQLPSMDFLSVCPGTTISIPFQPVGPYDEDNTFIAQLIDSQGKAVGISKPFKKSPIQAVIPSYKNGGETYRLQVVSTIPIAKSNQVELRLLDKPQAQLSVIDGSQTIRIMPGQEASLKVSLSGAAPWSFQLSDSTTVMQTLSNPHYVRVRPQAVKAYTIQGIANACGSGQASGQVIVNVDDNPEPKLELKDSDKYAKVCSGIPFQVPINATGKYNKGNKFVIQLADKSGVFKSISTPDSSGQLVTQIPASYKHGNYKLRVASTAPVLYSQATNISLVEPTVTTLLKDSLHLDEDQTGELTVKFSGEGPWFVLLSDGTYENNILESPHKIKIKPLYNTVYQISSAGGLCGVGTFSGQAKVSVKSPPVSIHIDRLPQNMACLGSTIEIPYKTSGRFNANNRFVVQITDKTGRFVDLPTTVTPTAMQVQLKGIAQTDTIKTQLIRIISSSPAVSSTQAELDLIAPNQALGEVSGQGIVAPGQSKRIMLKFKNGLPPWSFTLSDGSSISGTFLNPYLITVTPEKTTEYKISSLKSGCGTGIGKGSALIRVEK